MPSEAEKLLERMKRSDLERLYTGFGFRIEPGRGPHDKVFHPDFPQLITRLPRHRRVYEYLVTQAIRLIERLQELQKGQQE